MSTGKKWNMTKKQLHRNPHHRNWKHKVGGGKNGKFTFSYFRHMEWFKKLDGRISMRCIMVRSIWYYD